MDTHGHAWTSKGRHGQTWTSMDRHEQLWTGMDQHGQAWTSMDRHGQACTSMNMHGPAWTDMDRDESVKHSETTNKQYPFVFYRLGVYPLFPQDGLLASTLHTPLNVVAADCLPLMEPSEQCTRLLASGAATSCNTCQ